MVMTLGEKLSLSFVLCAVFLISSCGYVRALADQAQSQTQSPDANRLIALARAYAQGAHPAAAQTIGKQVLVSSASADGTQQDAEYKNEIMMDLVRKDYDALEKAAQEDRSPSARLSGGTWRVWSFYDGVDIPPGGDDASDDDWNARIDALKAWATARPQSSAAQLALAGIYDDFGRKARGGGYADSVSDDGWKLYNERLALAQSALENAAKLKEKSPYWYSLMYEIALAQGWDKSQAKQLLDAAISFEPSYYHVYRQQANYLLPKWYGQPGDAQAFADQVSNQIGGEQGDFVYFEIASTVVCGCDPDDAAQLQSFSWPRIKSGYAALEHLYGYSSLKANRFAFMALTANDKQSAQATFQVIGDNWNADVWHTQADFLKAKFWAEGPQGQ